MKAPDSSSSDASRLELHLVSSGLTQGLPAALLEGRDEDLWSPLRPLRPGHAPSASSAAGDRRALASGLAEANQSYGHPRAADLARRFAEPGTQVVVSGQQPGLFGGPLYTLSKIVATVKWAERLQERGQPAVALFWIASEDHDYSESARTVILTGSGPRELQLGPDPAPLLPLGLRTLGEAVTAAVENATAAASSPRWVDWWRRVATWYRPDARFNEAFSRLLTHLLGERCPLLVDAMLPAVKQAQRPLLHALIEERSAVQHALGSAEERVSSRGYPLQVQPQPEASPLFLLHRRERRRIVWESEEVFGLRGRSDFSQDVEALLKTVDQNPGVISPGVLARPALQDGVLGTTLQVLGPGEISYMVQAAALYPLLGVEPPWLTLRPQALVLEPRQIEQLRRLDLQLADLLGEPAALEKKLAQRQGADFVQPVLQRINEALDSLRSPVVELDASLERPWKKTRDQVVRAMSLLGEKVTAAAMRANQTQLRRVEQLRDACMPMGQLQERVVSSAHFPAKHGEEFVEALFEQLALEPDRLHPICL